MAQTDTHTDRQTDGHGDSMTNSAQWGRVGENETGDKYCHILTDSVSLVLSQSGEAIQ